MKEKLFGWIFKKEINKIHARYEFEKQQMLAEIVGMQAEITDIQKNYSIAKKVFYLLPNSEIMGIETNKNNEELYIVKSVYDSSLNIYLLGKSYQAINRLPRIMAEIKTDYQSKEKFIKIHDVQMIDNNIGNGSIAMEYFLKTAKKIEAKCIRGGLSSVDSDHFDRSEHYYKKFDFKVKFNVDRSSGNIEKLL